MNRSTLHNCVISGALVLMAGCQVPRQPDPVEPKDGRAIPAASVECAMTLADLTGGDLGIGGGFLVAASPERIQQRQHKQCLEAAQKAEESPAQLQQVRDATDADLNKDGFITLDEILAMSRAGLSDQEIGDRLRQTGYVFQMTLEQEHT